MYKRAILILQDRRFSHYIKSMMQGKKKEIERSLPLLSDFHSIKNEIVKNRNTINIRGQFGFFIKKHGFPYMIIMDYTADLGLPEDEDPDKRKLLRAFLISLVILAYGKGFDNATANIVFVVKKATSHQVSQYSKNPSILLEQIKTKDKRINTFLDSFAQSSEKTRKFFNISYIFQPEDGNYIRELARLEKIMHEADHALERKRETPLKKGREDQRQQTEMLTHDTEPASVICRASLEKIAVNGKVRQISPEEKSKYLEKCISLEGAITVKTMNTVKDRIEATFAAMQKMNPFKKNEKILFHVPDTSLIDGSFASSMSSFFSNELSQYTGISISLDKTNCDRLKNSKGYFLIKDYLIKNL